MAGLLDRLDDGLDVERLYRAQVDDFGLDAVLLLQLLGRDKGLADAAGEGDDGEVLARALDLCLAKLRFVSIMVELRSECAGLSYGNDEVILLGLLAHGEGETVQKPVLVLAASLSGILAGNPLVLQNNDRVGVADSGLQQTLSVLGAVWGDDLQTGDAAVPSRVVLGVLSSDTGGETVGATEGNIAGLDTTGHVVCLCGRVDDLVNSLHSEVERHKLALLRGQSCLRNNDILNCYSQWGADQQVQHQRSDQQNQTR